MAVDQKAMSSVGMAVDSAGNVAYDPSANVQALNEASSKRQDDLRRVERELVAEKTKRIEDIAALQARHNEETTARIEAHIKEIRALDSDRLEKVRQVDQLNAAQMAQQLLAAVQTLATTSQATAETLRNQVSATAAAVAAQNERVVNPIIERLSVLERSSYKGEGRQALADPQMERLAALVERLATAQTTGAGKSAGIGAVIGYIFGGVGLLTLILRFIE